MGYRHNRAVREERTNGFDNTCPRIVVECAGSLVEDKHFQGVLVALARETHAVVDLPESSKPRSPTGVSVALRQAPNGLVEAHHSGNFS